MGPEDAVESLHGDGEDGGAGAGERDLSKGQQPGHQAGVNLGGERITVRSYNKNSFAKH